MLIKKYVILTCQMTHVNLIRELYKISIPIRLDSGYIVFLMGLYSRYILLAGAEAAIIRLPNTQSSATTQHVQTGPMHPTAHRELDLDQLAA